MLSLSTGHDVGYLTGPVASAREGYYTGAVAAGEPAGLWYGRGAESLGLSGEVDADMMEAVFSHHLDPRDPNTAARSTWGQAEQLTRGHRNYRTAEQVFADLAARHPGAGPEELAELRAQAERQTRQAVSFIDATFSAPKSVTVLAVAFERAANDARAAGDHEAAAAWAAHQQAVEDAVMAGARASVDYLQANAGYSRAGHHGGGAGRWLDAHEWTVAGFLQHDSRDRDPQLHVHQAIWNRVLCSDGVWRTLDSKGVHAWRGAAGAVGERTMEAHLARAFGLRVETRPDGRAREVVGVPQRVMEQFSSRRRAVTAKTETLIAAYRERHGREPSALERTQIAQRATLSTRQAKAHDGETLEARLDRWEAETRAQLAGGLGEVGRMVLDRAQQGDPPAGWSQRDVIERALAAVGESRQTWTRSDLVRAISDALPGHLAVDPADVPELLDGLADAAMAHAVRIDAGEDAAGLPAELLRADGQSVYANPAGGRFALPEQLAGERRLRAAAVERGAHALDAAEAEAVIARFAEHGRELGADQAAAVRGVLTSGAKLETLVAAAGTGKSYVVGAVADSWTGGRVVGLAPSQMAANVLSEEGLQSANVAAWLGAQARGDDDWTLQPGDLVVLDEAGMCATADLSRIHARCDASGAKLLLVGDPRQLGAVGPGGALADVAEHGLRYELAEVRRFNNAWEGAASIRLRDGDPAALDDYYRHGRLMDGGTAEQAEAKAARAWLADTIAGREAVLVVGSNEAAARVSAALRADLVALGRVEEQGVLLAAEGTVAGVGDRVQARRNGWELVGHDGNVRAPLNRGGYTVTETGADGSLRVVDDAGVALTLPARYVAEDVRLAYASTVHAAQGVTVDVVHAVLGPGTDAGAAYVALTRGRDGNTAWTVTRNVDADQPTGATLDTTERDARAVLADVLDRRPDDPAATSATAQQEVGERDAVSAQRWIDRLAAEIADATAGRSAHELDLLAADGLLEEHHRVALAADPAVGGLDQLLRAAELAGHDPRQVLRAAVTERSLAGSRSPAQVVHSRITRTLHDQLAPQISSYHDLIPRDLRDGDQRARLEVLADAADDRRRQLGADTAAEASQWAVEALGPVPDDAIQRAEWEHRAGYAAAYREVTGHDRQDDALGAAPPAGLAELHATWRAGHQALDLPAAGAAEAEMSDGQLRCRVHAWEREKTWAPAFTDDRLAEVEQNARQNRDNATLWAARAEQEPQRATAEQLRADARLAELTADGLEREAEALELAGQARGRWYLATMATRENDARARDELGRRGVALDDPTDRVTADEWLAAHRAAQDEDERWREITSDDVHREDDHDRAPVEDRDALAETGVPDVRDSEPGPQRIGRGEHLDTESTAAMIARAQAALAELDTRAAGDDAHLDAERTDQLARWHADDQVTDDAGADDAAVFEY